MLIDKLLTLAFGSIFLLLLACSDAPETLNQHTTETPPPVTNLSASTAFLDYAASTNLLQIELARLAIERAQSEEVKVMGEHALKYHTHALNKLRATVGEAQRAHLPDSLGTADQGIVREFTSLPAAEFDSRYRDYIISSHSSQLERFQEELLKVEEKKTRKWIMEVEEHLRERIQLAKSDTIAL
ncbi:hypothetical protein OB13_08250 [Pontibacter sp. HJ8]